MEASGQLSVLLNVVSVIALKVPAKTSIRQIVAFIMIAVADSKNEPTTLGDLGMKLPQLFGESVKRNFYLTFSVPTDENPSALGWIEFVDGPNQRGGKPLRLTAKGRQIAESVSGLLAIE